MAQEIDLPLLVSAALGKTAVPLYLDRLSGQLLGIAEVEAQCGSAVAVQERYVRVPPVKMRLRLDDARDFATTLTDPVLRTRFETLLRGPRAAWAFEREIARQSMIARAWRSWEYACTLARMLGWMGRLGLPFPYPNSASE